MVGNSSSGIVEAPAAGVPSINIGDRQLGRLRAASIIDCPADPAAILAALKAVFDGRFRVDPAATPPYGRGGASDKNRGNPAKDRSSRCFPEAFP